MKIRLCVSALLIAAALFVCAARAAIAAPALWVVQSNVGKIYLFGTVHLLREGVPWRSPELEAAIKESQDLYLEIADPSDTSAALTSLVKIGFDRDHPLSTKISKADLALLDAAAKRYGLGSEAAFEPMRPWVAFMVLSVLPAAHSGYASNYGVDVQIRKEFVASGKPIHGFETFNQQAQIFADLPEAEQVALLEGTLKNIGQQTSVAKMDDLVNTWASGNQDALAAQLQTGKFSQTAFYQKVLTDRNKAWANALADRLKQPGTSFVSVGAAHLVGPGGVPALLAGMGFTVTRVQIQQTPQNTPAPATPAAPTPASSEAPSPSASGAPVPAASGTPTPTPSASPIPLTLTPPSGWKTRNASFTSGNFKSDRMFVDPQRGGAIITGHFDLPGITSIDIDTFDALFHQGLISGVGAKGVVAPSTRVKVCSGKQDGTYTKVRLSSVSQDIVVTVSDRGYMAQYIRPKDAPEDPAAMRSLLTLCAP